MINYNKKHINDSQQIWINIAASFVAYGVSLFISFFLSPYIVRTIGVEANGFVGLANNFVSYASLITIALNSLAGRFITISLRENDTGKANRYFTSVLFANTFLAAVLFLVGGMVVINLERLIEIPADITADVRLLFIALFLNCIISVFGSVFSVAAFATNKLYLESIRNIEANLLRAGCIALGFLLFTPRVSYIGLGSLLSGVYVLVFNMRYTKLLLPQIHIRREYYDFQKVRELISSGVWNTFTRLGQLILDGLDLLISNVFINATAMGVLSLSKTVPTLVSGVVGMLVGAFSPSFTFLYADGNILELKQQIKLSMKIMGVIANLPIIVLIVCGVDFFRIWQPTQDPNVLHQLSLLAVACLMFSGGINSLYSVFTVVNKIKANSIAVFVTGCVSTAITLLLVRTTQLGIYAVAGVSAVCSIIRNLVFTAPYGAKCLGLKWYTFYPDIFRPVLYTIVSVLCTGLAVSSLTADNLLTLFVKAVIVGIIAVFIGLWIILNKAERKRIFSKLWRVKHEK